MRGTKALLLGGLVLAVALSGCFGAPPPQEEAPPPPPPELDQTQQARLAALAAPEVRDYTLPGSAALAPQVVWFNGTIGAEANTGYVDRNMRGGNDYNVVLQTFDIANLLPDGQPTALRLKLVYFGQAGSSASAHIYACVPGYCSYYTQSNNDQFNWKATVETLSLMTVGVTGGPAVVGVAAASGLVVNPLDFYLEVQATYFQDVLTPVHAYAFTVPEGATGVTLRSVKPGQEHLQAKFIVLDPSDELVTYVEYDDIAIVSESMFIPTRQPGEYVFYAQEMHHGFFRLTSDAPLGNDTAVRILPVTRTEVVDFSGVAPGTPGRDWLGTIDVGAGPLPTAGVAVTPYSEGASAAFSLETFPLEIHPLIGDGVAGAVEVQILSPKGEVARLQRIARVDNESGSLGLTRDETNTRTDWSMLAKGSYTVSIVADGSTGDIGHVVLTYAR